MTACTVELRKRHPGQTKVMAEATRFNVLMCGRRFGKTALGTDIAVEAALAGEMVGWFAPTYKLLEEAWRELVTALIPIPGFEKSEQQHRIALPTGGTIECWSLDSEDPARGRKYHLAIIDEAGLVPRLTHIFQTAIRPTLADYAGGAWFLGTPKGVGDFSALWNQGAGRGPRPGLVELADADRLQSVHPGRRDRRHGSVHAGAGVPSGNLRGTHRRR